MEAVLPKLVYASLSLSLLAVVINSPLQNYRRGRTEFVRSRIPFEGSMFPTFSVCKVRGIRNGRTREVYKRVKGTEGAKEAVLGNHFSAAELGLSSMVLTGIGDAGETSHYSIDHDRFRKVPADLKAAGNCHSLELNRTEELGGLTRVYLRFQDQGLMEEIGREGNYLLSVHGRGDSLLAGIVLDGREYGVDRVMHAGGWMVGLSLTMEVEERIRDCNPAKAPITSCLLEQARVQGLDCGRPQEEIEDCSLEDYMARMSFSYKVHFHSYDTIADKTGCLIPCLRTAYSLQQLYTLRLDGSSVAPNASMDFQVNMHMHGSVRKITETPVYQLGDFVSDLGGLSGLFLGFSLWGFASAIREWSHAVVKKK